MNSFLDTPQRPPVAGSRAGAFRMILASRAIRSGYRSPMTFLWECVRTASSGGGMSHADKISLRCCAASASNIGYRHEKDVKAQRGERREIRRASERARLAARIRLVLRGRPGARSQDRAMRAHQASTKAILVGRRATRHTDAAWDRPAGPGSRRHASAPPHPARRRVAAPHRTLEPTFAGLPHAIALTQRPAWSGRHAWCRDRSSWQARSAAARSSAPPSGSRRAAPTACDTPRASCHTAS
jgi:hypothetical protein